MPSITPSYVYTLFACMIVGTMLVCAFSVSALEVKNEADQQQIRNLTTYLAAKSCELVSFKGTSNLRSECSLSVPGFVGNKQYWVQLTNDSNQAWVNVGFGTIPGSTDCRVPVPVKLAASGTYASGSGPLVLKCRSVGPALYLELSEGT